MTQAVVLQDDGQRFLPHMRHHLKLRSKRLKQIVDDMHSRGPLVLRPKVSQQKRGMHALVSARGQHMAAAAMLLCKGSAGEGGKKSCTQSAARSSMQLP